MVWFRYNNLNKCFCRWKDISLKRNLPWTGTAIMRNLSTSRACFNHLPAETHAIGSVIEGYKLQKITPVKELNLVAYELSHEKTGACHLHIAADDPNNAFSVSFKTPVNDDTGVAHILEHLVLCGSKKYPVHDPFFKMSLRSVSTFMNAMTFPDHTTYPFSSVNKKDFNNLLSVYMDCVFNPCLRQEDFLQEAWRIEPKQTSDPKSPLVFKGVVFNEMKGVLNSQSSVQDLEYMKHLLPTTYASNYGGNPLNIIDLTYEELVEFHRKFYHPSNSLFITYGNIEMEEHLKNLNKLLCDGVGGALAEKTHVRLPKEVTWDSPHRANSHIPFDPLLPDDQQSIFLLGFKMNPINYNRDIFVMSVLSQLLLIGPNSPFHKFLLTKNLGSDYCDQVGLSSYTNDPTFCVGLKGVKDNDVAEIESIILSTLELSQKDGFTDNHILGVMKETELAIKHIGSNTGINYATSIPTNWAHGHNPSDCLTVKQHLDYVYQNYRDGIFEKIIQNDLLDNQHRLALHLRPDVNFIEKLNKQEAKLLDKRISNKKETEKFEPIERKIEDSDQVDKILPKVTLNDLSDQIPAYVAEHNIAGDATPLQTTAQPTNGLAYVRINVNTNSLPLLLRPYLPLFSHVITQIGANEMSHEKIAELISLNSSPFSANPSLRVNLTNSNDYDKGLIFSSFCPYENTIKMMEIWNAIFSKPSITNDEHMRILVTEYIDGQLTSVVNNGHHYAMTRACSHLTRPYAYKESLGGWSQVEFSKSLANQLLTNPDHMQSICDKLLQIASCLFDRSKLSCFVVCEDHYMAQLVHIMNGFVSDVPTNFEEPFPVSKSSSAVNLAHIKEFIYMPSRVNYNCSAYRIPSFLHPDYPYFKVLSLLVTSKFLLPQIREVGGAYGAGAIASDGCLSFYSYRDPNLLTTYNNFENSIQWLINREYDLKSFDEAKVKAIGSILTPIPPSKRTLSLFTNGITNEHIVNYRDVIKGCQPEDIERVAKTYLCGSGVENDKQLPFVSSASIGENFVEIQDDSAWILNLKYDTSKR